MALINVDQLNTTATRELDARRAELEEQIQQVRNKATAQAEKMTLKDLKMAVAAPGGANRKSLLVEMYAQQAGFGSDAGLALGSLHWRVDVDRRFARQLNRLYAEAREFSNRLREWAGMEPFEAMTRSAGQLDTAYTRAALGGYAYKTAMAYGREWDLVKAVTQITNEALQTLLDLPTTVLTEGAGKVSRAAELHEAKAARMFLQLVGQIYGDEAGMGISLAQLR